MAYSGYDEDMEADAADARHEERQRAAGYHQCAECGDWCDYLNGDFQFCDGCRKENP